MQLLGKTIVITGASKGLGKALAQQLSMAGANLVLNARSKEPLEVIAKELNAPFHLSSTSNPNEMHALANLAVQKFGNIDVWINNAGAWSPRPSIHAFDADRARELIETNLFGTIFGAKAAIAHMLPREQGVIINILSTTALDGKNKSAAYGADKFGARGFTLALREELKTKKIQVIGVYPGGMQTDIFAQKPMDYNEFLRPDFVAGKIIENLLKETPEEELILRRQ